MVGKHRKSTSNGCESDERTGLLRPTTLHNMFVGFSGFLPGVDDLRKSLPYCRLSAYGSSLLPHPCDLLTDNADNCTLDNNSVNRKHGTCQVMHALVTTIIGSVLFLEAR